jgi:hypothetical protein
MPRKNSTEFGGEGGLLPPEPYELTVAEEAALIRRVPPTRDDVTEEQVRAEMAKRAKKNDVVGT